MYDILIIGAGPAGISSGLYAKRAGNNVLILYHGTSNLEKAHQVDNYYGFENGISGNKLYETGIQQAKNMGIDVKKEEVLNIEKKDNIFVIYTENNTYTAKSVIISTGNKKIKPDIKGITNFEGKGISYCAICDGYFYKNKNVAIIGNGKFAINEANELNRIVNKITILTNGTKVEDQCNYEIITKKIKEVHGENKVNCIEFDDGSTIEIDGVFIAIGEAGGSDFAKKMGVIIQNDNIIVDENMQTNISGLFACGNSTGGLLQVCKAVYEGAKAGLSASNYIKKFKEE